MADSVHSARYLITAPTDDVVTLDEAKAQLRITGTSEDDLIQMAINAAVDQLDPAGGGWLGRALRSQTWELRLSGFPCQIELPYPPLTEIVSVKYDDASGTEQTLVQGTDYRIFGFGGKATQAIAPLFNARWPIPRSDQESVRVRYTCGYVTSPADVLPPRIKQAVMLGVRELYDIGRRSLMVASEDLPGVRSVTYVVTENAAKVMRTAADTLLSNYRVWT